MLLNRVRRLSSAEFRKVLAESWSLGKDLEHEPMLLHLRVGFPCPAANIPTRPNLHSAELQVERARKGADHQPFGQL